MRLPDPNSGETYLIGTALTATDQHYTYRNLNLDIIHITTE